MSEAQWAARRLDEPENIEEAVASVRQAINVFKHLRFPQTQGDLRESHNMAWCEMDIFNDALCNLSAGEGHSEPPPNLTWLWQEFVA